MWFNFKVQYKTINSNNLKTARGATRLTHILNYSNMKVKVFFWWLLITFIIGVLESNI